jgi:biotin--protein ligase
MHGRVPVCLTSDVQHGHPGALCCAHVVFLQGGIDVQIKWPNDIYYSGVKIGGALIHTTWTASKFSVLTGIGLNVSNSQPTTCLDDIIEKLQQQQQQQPAAAVNKVNKEQLLASVLTHLESCFDQFERQGFAPLQPLYLASWMHSNQQVELEEGVADAGGSGLGGPPGQQQQQQRVTLKIVGLSPYGFLLAVDASGQQFELTPDGNSLDMMQGLIRKKLN